MACATTFTASSFSLKLRNSNLNNDKSNCFQFQKSFVSLNNPCFLAEPQFSILSNPHSISRSQSTFNGFKCFVQKSEPSVSVDSRNDAEESLERVVVLVVGGGGREHALCHALKRSPSCDAVFCAPGNAGISSSEDATCISDLDIFDSSAVIAFCRQWGVGLVVVGPEAPLVSGLANNLVKAGIPTFGPSSEAAALEGSKNFMKSFV